MGTHHLDERTLSLLLDDQLTEGQRKTALKHLAGCPSCEQAYQNMETIALCCAQLEEVAPPQGFAAFGAEILANLPPQDPVSSGAEDQILVKEFRAKAPGFWTSLDWKQLGGLAACAVLGLALWQNAGSSRENVLYGTDPTGAVASNQETGDASPAAVQREAEGAGEEFSQPFSAPGMEEPASFSVASPEEDLDPGLGDLGTGEPGTIDDSGEKWVKDLLDFYQGAATVSTDSALSEEAGDQTSQSVPSVQPRTTYHDLLGTLTLEQTQQVHTVMGLSSSYPPVTVVLEGAEDYPGIPPQESWAVHSVAPDFCYYQATAQELGQLFQDYPQIPQIDEAVYYLFVLLE